MTIAYMYAAIAAILIIVVVTLFLVVLYRDN